MTNGVGHLFMYLLTIWINFSVQGSFQNFHQFFCHSLTDCTQGLCDFEQISVLLYTFDSSPCLCCYCGTNTNLQGSGWVHNPGLPDPLISAPWLPTGMAKYPRLVQWDICWRFWEGKSDLSLRYEDDVVDVRLKLHRWPCCHWPMMTWRSAQSEANTRESGEWREGKREWERELM